MMTAALFTILTAQAHTDRSLLEHRMLQAGCGNVVSRVSEVNTACPCPAGGGAGGGGHRRRTQTCTPTACSSSCATVFVPFLNDCGVSLQAAGQDLSQFFGLYYSCHQAIPCAGCAAAPSPPAPPPCAN
eukprot:COSAG01_NODE_37827_length_498_cov_1.035088_1_plen_128_part_10